MTADQPFLPPAKPGVYADTVVITHYPLSSRDLNAFVDRVEGEVTHLTVAMIVSAGHLNLVRYLRSIRCNRVIAYIPNVTQAAFLEVLIIIATLVRSDSAYWCMPDGELQPIKFRRGLLSAFRIALMLAFSIGMVPPTWLRVKWLARKPRTKVIASALERRAAIFLKMTLWLGIQVGGAVTHARGIVRALARTGLEISAFTSEPHDFSGIKGVQIHGIPVNSPYVSPRELSHFVANHKATKWLRNQSEADSGFVYQRLTTGNFVGVEVSRRCKIPLVVEYNGPELWLSDNWGTPYFFRSLVRQIEDLNLRHAHLVATVSDALRNELVERGVADNRVVVAPNGFDPEIFSDAKLSPESIAVTRREWGVDDDHVVFTFVGTFGPWHGVEIFARAVRQYFEAGENGRAAKSARFFFIGDGVRRRDVVDILGEYVSDPRVVLTGTLPMERVVEYLCASDVGVLPIRKNADQSEFFGSPTKLFEYMASGCPVIATQEGQIGDILKGSPHINEFESVASSDDAMQLGVFIDADRVDQLYEAMRTILENPKWLAAASKNVRARALNRHSWSTSVDLIMEQLSEITKSDSKGRVRLLINGLHSKSGGGVTYLKNFLGELHNREFEVHLLLHTSQVALFKKNSSNVTLHTVGGGAGLLSSALIEQTYCAWLSWRLAADITFSPANFGPLFARKQVILLRNALNVRKFELRFFRQVYWWLLEFATLVSAIRAERVIAVSSYAASVLPNWLRSLYGDRISIIPHGVNEMFTSRSFEERAECKLLFVSDIYIQKNLHSLIEVVGRLKRRFDVHLDVVGAFVDEDYTNVIRSSINAHRLRSHVTIHGHVDHGELLGMYQTCTVFVFPSTVETFGNPLVEAMACGAPIACSNTSAMPDVAGNAAMYFDPLDIEGMEEVLASLLKNKAQRQALSERAIVRSKSFSWRKTVVQTTDVFFSAIDG